VDSSACLERCEKFLLTIILSSNGPCLGESFYRPRYPGLIRKICKPPKYKRIEGLFLTLLTSTLDGRDLRYRLRPLCLRVTSPGLRRVGGLKGTHSRSGSFGEERNLFPPPPPRETAPVRCLSSLQSSLCT